MRRIGIALAFVIGCGDAAQSTDSDASATSTGAPQATGETPTSTDDGTTDAPACGFAVLSAAAWPEADALFHRDPRWLGADDAYSVALGGDRVLWLFGDTFIATSDAHTRDESRLIHNSVAVQTGLDPAAADIEFFWRDDGEPASWFAERDDLWFWPGDGERVGDGLVVFLMAVRKVDGGFGFEVAGADVVWIADIDAAPDTWQPVTIASYREAGQVPGSASVLVEGDHLHAFTKVDGGADLLRWPVAAVGPAPLPAPEVLAPQPVLPATQTEFSVHHDAARGVYVHVQSEGFGGTDLAYRTAPALTGPWTAPQVFHRPPESDRADAFVYAGKAHPELTGADLAVTYVANSFEFADLFADPSLYYPRFVRVSLGCAE